MKFERWRRLAIALGIVAAISGLGAALIGWQRPPHPLAALEQLSLPDAQGRLVSLKPSRSEARLINFWGTWCPPCREEMPLLAAAAQRYPHIAFTGIAIDTPAALHDYAAQHATPYPLLLANYPVLALTEKFGNTSRSLPFTIIVDAQGNVVTRRQGAFKAEELDRILASLVR